MDYPSQDDPCVAERDRDPHALADDRRRAGALPDEKPGGGAMEAPDHEGWWRKFCRVLFGLNAIAFGIIMMLPPLGEPFSAENTLTIGISLVYLFVGWLFIAGRQNKWFKTPF